LETKQEVYNLSKQFGYNPQLEVAIGEHEADVVVTSPYDNNFKIAVECQCSQISLKEVMDRNETYKKNGFAYLWIFAGEQFDNMQVNKRLRFVHEEILCSFNPFAQALYAYNNKCFYNVSIKYERFQVGLLSILLNLEVNHRQGFNNKYHINEDLSNKIKFYCNLLNMNHKNDNLPEVWKILNIMYRLFPPEFLGEDLKNYFETANKKLNEIDSIKRTSFFETIVTISKMKREVRKQAIEYVYCKFINNLYDIHLISYCTATHVKLNPYRYAQVLPQ
jgi:hypothetical protein